MIIRVTPSRHHGARGTFPGTGQLYRSPMGIHRLIPALAAGLMLCGCGASTVVQPTPGTGHPVPGGSALIDALTTRCGALPPARYALGHESSGSLIGNPQPLAISMTAGSSIVLSAQFNQRHLGPFDVASGDLRIRCSVDLDGPEGGPAAVLTAAAPGVATVSASTDDCSACANIPLDARITVVKQ